MDKMAKQNTKQNPKQNTKKATPSGHRQENPAESLDAVRDLLFGSAATEFGEKITSLEQQLGEQLAEVHSQSEQALAELRTQQVIEFRASKVQGNLDRENHADALAHLEAKVDALFNGLTTDLSALTRRLAESDSELRQQLQLSVTGLRNDVQAQLSGLETRIEAEVDLRRTESVSRSQFVEVMQSAIAVVEGNSAPKVRSVKAS